MRLPRYPIRSILRRRRHRNDGSSSAAGVKPKDPPRTKSEQAAASEGRNGPPSITSTEASSADAKDGKSTPSVTPNQPAKENVPLALSPPPVDADEHSDGTHTSAASSSGASGPGHHKSNRRKSGYESSSSTNGKSMKHTSSVIGLDSMIELRREEGDLKSNVVHIEVPFGKPIEEVYNGVHDGPVLGSGISGLVRLATHKATGVKYAVKCLDLGLIETEEGLNQLREEIYVMCQLDHPNIVRLDEVYESHNEIYLVQELCLGGELFDRLDEQPDYHYTEQQCARLIKQMLSAVKYIHKQGIVHRDLKLENFLFSSTSPDSELKMIDFGLSKHFMPGEVQKEAVGTPYTVAPEVIRGSYDERCDVWAIGVITFLLLSGDPPFGGCGGPEPLMTVRNNILRGAFEFEPYEVWKNVSTQARAFISSLLVINPVNRPNAAEAAKSAWLQEWANNEKSLNPDAGKLNPNVVQALVTFKEYSDMKKLLCEVLSFTLLPDQIQGLRAEFEKMDTDGSGEISLDGLKQVLMVNAGAGSLGALTEEEVMDIFNAMRVRKTETTIRWHEFIAAGLSQCEVDDRNLRLAFDRLDADHKGFITFDDVLDLMGSDGTEETVRVMYQDSLNMCRCEHSRISYDDFVLLMKGQPNEQPKPSGSSHSPITSKRRMQDGVLPMMPVILGVAGVADGSTKIFPDRSLHMLCEVSSREEGEVGGSPEKTPGESAGGMSARSAGSFLPSATNDHDSPLSWDDDDVAAMPPSVPAAADGKRLQVHLPVPMQPGNRSPIIASTDLGTAQTTPRRPQFDKGLSVPARLSPVYRNISGSEQSDLGNGDSYRKRSSITSVEEVLEEDVEAQLVSPPDTRRAVVLPEHEHNNSGLTTLINDETKTPLVVNRELYRAHRMMRLAVLEASKRFEEKQLVRTRNRMENDSDSATGAVEPPTAGLVMRRGHNRENSIQRLMKQSEMETQQQLEKVTRRTGRGRRNRNKTVSDVSGMLANAPPSKPDETNGPTSASLTHTGEGNTGRASDGGAHVSSAGMSTSGKPALIKRMSSHYSDGKLNEQDGRESPSPPSGGHAANGASASQSVANAQLEGEEHGEDHRTINSCSTFPPPMD